MTLCRWQIECRLFLKYVKTGSVFEDACNIIETAQKVAYSAVDLTLVHRNWLLGKRIADEELNGE